MYSAQLRNKMYFVKKIVKQIIILLQTDLLSTNILSLGEYFDNMFIIEENTQISRIPYEIKFLVTAKCLRKPKYFCSCLKSGCLFLFICTCFNKSTAHAWESKYT